MGWLVYDKPVHVKAHLDNGWSQGYTLVASVLSGFTYYAAVRDDETGDVIAAVTLVRYYRDRTMGVKHMDDAMGPCERECPKSILDLLTSTDNQCAQEWRDDCREHLRKRAVVNGLKRGEIFRVKDPIDFNNGTTHQVFSVVRKTTAYVLALPEDGSREVRIPRRSLIDRLEV